MEESREEIDLLVRLLGMKDRVRVANGAPHALPDLYTPIDCPGSRLIIEEAVRDDDAPLFVAFLGPLTDMASALILEPSIADRDVTVIWIGGAPYGDAGAAYKPEFNVSNDIVAANVVFSSTIKLWQVPMSTYVMMAVSYAELFEQVRPNGELGRYLVDQLVRFNREHSHSGRVLEFRSLGDSPAVGLMLNQAAGLWTERPAPGFYYDCSYDFSKEYRTIRVYDTVDGRFILSDMLAKLRAHTSSVTRA
jgi:inosine-uridine nucleoside N-ribohydrolase